MKILVTGGAGFIGSHVVDAYIERGHDVVVVDNLATGSRDNLNPKAAFVEIDIGSDQLGAVFAEHAPEVVNHLAAQIDVRLSVEKPLFDAQTNVLGSINVLQNCVDHGVGKFIFASTGGAIYGDAATLPASEEQTPRPLCHYGVAKYCVENYIRLYGTLHGLRYTILRFPNVYGPRQNPRGEAGVCAILTGLMLEGKTPVLYGHGQPLRDYVYVGDIARANALALDAGDGEVLNLGSGKGASVLDIFNGLKEILAFDQEPRLEPLRPGEVENNYITGDRAAAVLGWRPEVELRDGLARTVAHVRREA
ncbi:MAG: NAD-dependent epimerase/dehydratase family protein [Candidatus Hydrogenedentes bacterium]|nr:NAD-dependent epimerase/dehydratase family protein [Candidatus Hydrogenedentota bacterium]